MSKSPVLFLCHRIPFPPNKGDKITTFNLLKFLAKHYDVHLGFFLDDPFDKQYVPALDEYCKSKFYIDICDRKQSISGLKALVSNDAITIEHYKEPAFQTWVDETIAKQGIQALFVYSSGIAQFVQSYVHDERYVKVLDMADIDSDKWRQYAENKPWFTRWIYAREQRKLATYEQQMLNDFNAVTLISDEEAKLFREMSPAPLRHKVHTLSNGVDTDYFCPTAEFDLTDLPQLAPLSICFTGAMDYWANVDAVVWFCENVWPSIISQHPECKFYIVGGNPTAKVQKLANLNGVVVTGRVPDVRPYIDASVAAVAPMRIARGIQNKVLEAMAMAKPVVMTTMGQEGIEMPSVQQPFVLDDAAAFGEAVNQLLNQLSPLSEPLTKQGALDYSDNRNWIIERYGWDGALRTLPSMLAAEDIKDNL